MIMSHARPRLLGLLMANDPVQLEANFYKLKYDILVLMFTILRYKYDISVIMFFILRFKYDIWVIMFIILRFKLCEISSMVHLTLVIASINISRIQVLFSDSNCTIENYFVNLLF